MLDIRIGGQPVKVDPDRLTPTARALAAAIADAGDTVDIWVESDAPLSDLIANWELFYSADEAARGDRRPWRGWSDLPLGDGDPHERLEHEAAKIPHGWHVLGAHPRRPLPDAGPVREAPIKQVLGMLAKLGRPITAATWRAYVARGQAPKAIRTTSGRSVWDLDEVEQWHRKGRESTGG